MTVADLIQYLLDRDATHDLAQQLAFVDEQRRQCAIRLGAVR